MSNCDLLSLPTKGESPLFADIDINVYVGDITPNDGVPSFVRPAFDEQAFVAEVCINIL